MKTGFYKKELCLIRTDERVVEHKDGNGKLLYTEFVKDPVYEEKETFIEFTAKELLINECSDLKAEIVKVKEKIEQVNYGIPRDDYKQNLSRFKEIVNRLEVIESELNVQE